MTAPNLYRYLSPRILPIFPRATGIVGCAVDPQRAIDLRAHSPVTGTIEITFTAYADGSLLDKETIELSVDSNVVDCRPLWRVFDYDELGYVEIGFRCSEPALDSILPEPGYAVLTTPGNGSISLNPDMKYANPRVITQMEALKRFCVLHSAIYSDRAAGCGNSLLLINPYDQALVVKILCSNSRRTSCRIDPKSARSVDLAEIADDGQVCTMMLTANNRVVSYDVRHAYGHPGSINSIDHHDPYSGVPTMTHVGPGEYLRAISRKLMRATQIRPD